MKIVQYTYMNSIYVFSIIYTYYKDSCREASDINARYHDVKRIGDVIIVR